MSRMRRAPIPGPRHSAAVPIGELICVVGGRMDTFDFNTGMHVAYDPKRDILEERAPMPDAALWTRRRSLWRQAVRDGRRRHATGFRPERSLPSTVRQLAKLRAHDDAPSSDGRGRHRRRDPRRGRRPDERRQFPERGARGVFALRRRPTLECFLDWWPICGLLTSPFNSCRRRARSPWRFTRSSRSASACRRELFVGFLIGALDRLRPRDDRDPVSLRRADRDALHPADGDDADDRAHAVLRLGFGPVPRSWRWRSLQGRL